jgi:putative ABC transport system substrate-binding protein
MCPTTGDGQPALLANRRARGEARLPRDLLSRREFVDAGGLAKLRRRALQSSYRTAATYSFASRTGAAPAALPVAQPTHFEMVVSERTAKALGLGIPPTIRASADVLP